MPTDLPEALRQQVQTTATTGKLLIAYVVGGLLLYFAWKGLKQ